MQVYKRRRYRPMAMLLVACVVKRSAAAFVASHGRIATAATRLFSNDDNIDEFSGYSRPVIQWYPGHIAKAERSLHETLKAVDVVVEVRDARALLATAHPLVPTWCAGKPRIVALTHVDAIPVSALRAWDKVLKAESARIDIVDKQVLNQAKQARIERNKYTTNDNENDNDTTTLVESYHWLNAKQGGQAISTLKKAILLAGAHVQERRNRRGLLPRPLRVGCLGYPNVGKSALINQIVGRRQAPSKNIPGVTKSLQWIRVKTSSSTNANAKSKIPTDFELLDSPGVIPASIDNQDDAVLLAACNCIGQAAYDNQGVATQLCEYMLRLHRYNDKLARIYAPEWQDSCIKRYQVDPLEELKETDLYADQGYKLRPRTGEDMLHNVADNTCQGDLEDAARKILQDFRKLRWGPISLQAAPENNVNLDIMNSDENVKAENGAITNNTSNEQAQRAKVVAAARGLELPPKESESVGRGMFEGW